MKKILFDVSRDSIIMFVSCIRKIVWDIKTSKCIFYKNATDSIVYFSFDIYKEYPVYLESREFPNYIYQVRLTEFNRPIVVFLVPSDTSFAFFSYLAYVFLLHYNIVLFIFLHIQIDC